MCAPSRFSTLVHDRRNVEERGELVDASQRRRGFLRSLYTGGNAPEWRTAPADQASRHVLPEGTKCNDWVYDNVLP